MRSGTLKWFADRGFELDVEAADEDVAIRLQAVPVPADGTAELRRGVDLDRLDILFKASVEIHGEPAQLQDARIQIVTERGKPALSFDATCEDVETGDLIPVKITVPIALPDGAPEKGGPRPVPTNEDDLDWEDETTLEQLVVNAPEAPIAEPKTPAGGGGAAPGSAKGLQALLKALARLDDDEDEAAEPEPEPEPVPEPARKGRGGKRKTTTETKPSRRTRAKPAAEPEPAPKAKTPKGSKARGAKSTPPAAAPARPPRGRGMRALSEPIEVDALEDDGPADGPGGDGTDQSLGADGEARSLLDLLVSGGNLAVEGDLAGLVGGVAEILALPLPAESKALRLSNWLLKQDSVADLFIGDDDLAEILERW